jgi:hypothetical protein
MTVKELITLLMLQEPDAEVVMTDSSIAPVDDEGNWVGIAKVISAQQTTFFAESSEDYGYTRANAVRLEGF